MDAKLSPDREVAAWRRETRKRLLAARAALAPEKHARLSAAVLANVQALPDVRKPLGTVAAYRPMRGEIDPEPLLAELRIQGVQTALPTIVTRAQPLVFRAWRPGEPLEPGPFGTEQPVGGEAVRPSVLLIPLVGFDGKNYRVGYGGGYYDRTLAALDPKPFTIGLGFELGRLPTIRPQPHDVALDTIVTEA